MPTDFERDLSELLHALTPEPPDHLASPRVATLREAPPAEAGADVIELSTGPGHAPSRPRRWPVIAAAAAVVALAAGVVALTQIGNSGRPATTAGSSTTTSHTATAPRCRNDQLVLVQGRDGLATHGRTGTAQLTYRNTSAKQCALELPVVAIGTEPTGGTPFPANTETVRIPGHGRLVMTAYARIAGRCRTAEHGLRINVTRGAWTYSSLLGVAGCTLAPLRLTHRVAG